MAEMTKAAGTLLAMHLNVHGVEDFQVMSGLTNMKAANRDKNTRQRNATGVAEF